MSKGSVSKNFDVVAKDPPMDGANFHENPGIMPTKSELQDAGWKSSNTTAPEKSPGGVPSYPKGSGY